MPVTPPPVQKPLLEKGFQDSLKKFKARLTGPQLKQFQFATLEDLEWEARKIQKEQAARAAAMNLPRISSFVLGFKQFGEIVEVFLNTSNFVAFVWGPMKFLLQVSAIPEFAVGYLR